LALAADLKGFFSNPRRMANGLPMLIAFIFFGYVFVDLKSDVWAINGFKWDPFFAQLDKSLHFGVEPWVWLQPILGYPIVTFFLNIVYNLWFFVMWAVWVYFGFAEHGSEVRTRFFITFFAMWILGGNLLAIYFSSAGPCFYGRLGHEPDLFAGLMTYLHQANQSYPIWAVSLQDVLWQGHLDHNLAEEISAMPSMHNGSSLLFALAAYQMDRRWGHILAVNTVLIFLGSIHLGWHYAVDAYVAWALCIVLWLTSAPVARWWHGRAPQQAYSAALAARG
jgi:PAP2 superfamily